MLESGVPAEISKDIANGITSTANFSPDPRLRLVRRTDDAGSTKLRADPEEQSAFAVDDVDGEETDVQDGEAVTVLRQVGDYTLVQTGEDLRQGYILSAYLHLPVSLSTAPMADSAGSRTLEHDFDGPRAPQSTWRQSQHPGATITEQRMSWETAPASAAHGRSSSPSTELLAIDQSRVGAIAAAKDELARTKAAAREMENALRAELRDVRLQAEQEQLTLSAKLERSQRDITGEIMATSRLATCPCFVRPNTCCC